MNKRLTTTERHLHSALSHLNDANCASSTAVRMVAFNKAREQIAMAARIVGFNVADASGSRQIKQNA